LSAHEGVASWPKFVPSRPSPSPWGGRDEVAFHELGEPVPRVGAQASDAEGHRVHDMADLTEPCPNCGRLMRWETSHERCDGCGYIRPCCEGAPCPIP
jgi:hypothetical protein